MTDSMVIEQLLADSTEELSYEQAFERLEQIVALLEGNEHSLEISLKLFERGQQLAHYCAELLDQAELRIQQLGGTDLSENSTLDE